MSANSLQLRIPMHLDSRNTQLSCRGLCIVYLVKLFSLKTTMGLKTRTINIHEKS